MNTTNTFSPAASLPLTVARQVDDVCGEFEAAWLGSTRPDVAAFADRVTGTARTPLLRELIRLDAYYRRKSGETPTAGEYAARFPELAESVVASATDETVSDGGGRTPVSDPDRLVSGHVLLGELGRGGMGVVYKARHVGLNRVVALKMIRSADLASAAELSRFRTEAEAVARLQHPNIVPIFEVGECVPAGSGAAVPYLSLEYAPGGTLAARFDRTPQPARPAAEVVEALARGVQHAHDKGIVHRDLKPANVLLADDGTPKLTDFGLAKRLGADDDQTRTGAVMGTPAYMAPEQAAGHTRSVGPAADVYALGAILYEALTGGPPFRGESAVSTLEMVRTQEPVPPRRLLPTVPRDLEVIALKCLAKDPARRYGSAAELAADLRRFLDGRPILARPTSAWERGWKFVRRRPWASGFAAAAVLSLVAAVGILAVKNAEVRAALAGEKQARGEVDEKNGELAGVNKTLAENVAALEVANGRVREEKKAADEKAAEALVLVNFFEKRVFAAGRPFGQQGGLGKNVSLRDAILASLPALSDEFTDRPLVEATLRHSLGETLFYLGESAAALGQVERARPLYLKHLGPDHRQTIASGHNLAQVYSALGRHADALKLRERVLADRTRVLGDEHPDTLSTRNDLATSYDTAGRREKALELRERVLAARERVLPKDDPETLRSRHNLAMSYFTAGRRDEALALNERTLEARRRVLPKDHPDTLTSMGNLATCYAAVQGRQEEGLKLHLEALAGRRRALPKGHPSTLSSLWAVAYILCTLRRSGEALPYIDECLESARGQADISPKMVPELTDFRLRHFQRANDPVGCRSTAEKWEGFERTDADSLYKAAGMRAVAAGVYARKNQPAEAKVDADRAMGWLTKAVAGGFTDRGRVDMDADLADLRGRDDFKKLVAGVGKPADR